jgi:hypothetical protein
MARHVSFHSRFLWLVLIILLSMCLVGAALAAASSASKSIIETQAITPPGAHQGQSSGSLDHSPLQPVKEPAIVSKGDPAVEQMRQQAMSASRSLPSTVQVPNLANGDVFQSSSLASQGAGTMYLPNGIVVDTYLDSIYGYTTPWADIVVTTDGVSLPKQMRWDFSG